MLMSGMHPQKYLMEQWNSSFFSWAVGGQKNGMSELV